jgi:murein DD-endopeptidase MepM/ murein hydrolase activator NlpD
MTVTELKHLVACRQMRNPLALLVGLALVLSVAPTAPGFADDSDAQRAAKEIADARERANAAATAVFDAESRLDQLDIEQETLRQEVAALQAQVDQLQRNVEAVAVNRFTRSGTTGLPLLTGFESAGDQAQMDVLLDVVNETSAEDFDTYDSLSLDLADSQRRLEQAEANAEAARDELERRRDAALAEVERLKEVEAQRLKDEAVRKALAAEEAERRRKAEAEAAAAAAAAAEAAKNNSSNSNSSNSGGSGASNDNGSNGGGSSDSGGDAGGDTGSGGSSGGSGGGQTGGGGSGGDPGSGSNDYATDGWVCPVNGPVGFGDTWGAPRSGGRSHQGVDMIGARGLPLVAVVDGFVQQKTNSLGGNAVWLSGADGNKYYYAHLDSWGAGGSVTAGTVIGYLGDTGNARFSVPHLHFEIHPGGGAAVNPYPTVRAHC